MNDHFHSAFIRHRTYLRKKIYEIAAEFLRIYSVVSCKSLAELVQGEAFLASRKAGYHVSRDKFDFSLIHFPVPCLGLGNVFLGIFPEGGRTFQYEKVESHEGGPLETERP